MIVTEQGNVYGTGDNYYGQLGIGNNTNKPGWAHQAQGRVEEGQVV